LDDEAMRLQPSAPSLIEQLIPQRSLSVIYGEPGAGKSFLVLDLACSIAAGIPWHGRAVHQGPVVYVAAEGRGGMPARITAWKGAHGAEGTIGVHFLPEPVRLVEHSDARGLMALLKALPESPVLVIFDTLARSMAGSDENSGKDMGILVDVADQIRNEIPCTVLFVHHPTKGDRRDERGSGQLRGAADMMAVVVRRGSTLVVECEKPKDYAPFSPMRFELVPYLDSCVVIPMAVAESHRPDDVSDDQLSRQERAALSALVLADNGKLASVTWKAACERQGVPASTFYNVSEKLVSRELVLKEREGRGVWYCATEMGRTVGLNNSNGPAL
jgi:hypothetical protein